MRFVSLASGSSGNCTCIGSGSTHILIDAGISGRKIEAGLHALGVKKEELAGLVLTHEHTDHIRGLPAFLKKNPLPLYGTAGTLAGVRERLSLPGYPEELFVEIRPAQTFSVGDLALTAFSTMHDAADPVGYRVRCGKKQVAVATDMGCCGPDLAGWLSGLDAALIEANHDIRMLEAGPYPYYLKRRILSDQGHLSNEAAGRLISSILHDGLRFIFLGHLSRENNYAQLAVETVKWEIEQADTPYSGNDFPIETAPRGAMSRVVEL